MLSRLGVEGDQVAVEARHEHLVAVQRDPAAGVVEGLEVLRQLPPVPPEELAGLGVQRDHLAVGGRDEHHAVVDEGGRLVARVHPGREGPDRDEPLDVGGFDLVERAVAPALVVASDLQPVLRFRLHEPFVGHGAVHALCHHRRWQHREAKHRCERRKGSGCLHDRPSSCRSGLYD